MMSSNSQQLTQILVKSGGGEQYLTGYLLRSDQALVVFAKVTDWAAAGICVLHPNSVHELPADDELRFFSRVMETLEGHAIPLPHDLEIAAGFQQVFEFAMRTRSLVSIEGENEGEYEIVRILAVSEHAAMACFLNADGTWRDGNDWLKFSSVSMVTFFDPYCLGIQRVLEFQA